MESEEGLSTEIISRNYIIIHQCKANDGLGVSALLPVAGANRMERLEKSFIFRAIMKANYLQLEGLFKLRVKSRFLNRS